jgi:peptidyl-prolyl cis-trans isomerase B (cyclophilin B)
MGNRGVRFGALFVILSAVGCGAKGEAPAPQAQANTPPAAPAAPPPAGSPPAPEPIKPAALDPDFLHLPFDQAVRPDVPLGPGARPADVTTTGKSVGKLYAAVTGAWNDIRFVGPDGKKIGYTATLETDLGTITLELLPELAPNHVRNFIALAKAGYYDGLVFETRIGHPADATAPRAVAGGAPEGDGNDLGGLGYWLLPEILKPEIAAKRGVKHEPGTVGAVHAYGQPDTAATRFYVCLTPAPAFDGEYTIFARVKQGLDVAQKMHALPVQDEQASPSLFRAKPVIRKVTISAQPLDTAPAKP